ncbi:helix-turn-helix transcriptional regulator [Xanthomonas cassavae]|uniref:helix-turn-helix domain-containing protein n=1 Tax=Xanthomonas cassavae TaxID=56450 RepID=UPI002E1519CF
MTADGLTIAEIAERLHRSPKTISNQKIAAMRKLGARNDVELAALMQKLNQS